jgi:hypothetical protein
VLKEEFPYTDSITLHGWYGEVSNLVTYFTVTPHKLLQIRTSDYYNATLNGTNPNIYDKVRLDFRVWVSPVTPTAQPDESFYLKFKDSENRDAITLRFDLENTGFAPYMDTTLNKVTTHPTSNVTPIWSFIPCGSGGCESEYASCNISWSSIFTIGLLEALWNCRTPPSANYPEYSYMDFELYADQTAKTYDISFVDWNGQRYQFSDPIPFTDTDSGNIDKLVIENGNLTSLWSVYL